MIFVTGGTGFIGRALIRQLTAAGHPVRTLLRPSRQSPHLPPGVAVEAAVCSLQDERGLQAALKGVDVIYHLAGTERLGSKADLNGVDVEGTEAIVKAAEQSGVRRLVFLSHLGADRASAFPVYKAKGLAEGAIQRSNVPYTIIRSANVFGPGDQFTVGLAQLLRSSPGVFLMPGGGKNIMQPLWVEDLVTLLALTIEDPLLENQNISVGGAETLSFRQIVNIILEKINLKRVLLPVPLARLRGLALTLEQWGKFPLSIYWLDTLLVDRTCPVDTLPRRFGLMPARFHQQLGYLK